MKVAPHVHDAVGIDRRPECCGRVRVVPELRPGRGVEGVDVAVIAPYVDDAVGDGGGSNVVLGREAPELSAVARAQGVDVVVGKLAALALPTHIDHTVDDDWGGKRVAPGRDVPELGSGGGVEGVEVAIHAPT